jgi:hypothetical protein
MSAIVDFLSTIVNAVLTLGDMGIWLAQGLASVGSMMMKSIAVFGSVMRIFPFGVASAVTGVCGGLIVLRIFGRS